MIHLPERIEIRKATMGDATGIASLLQEAASECPDYYPIVPQNPAALAELAESLARDTNACVVATADGALVGFARGYLLDRERADIVDIYVSPKFRNLGIGTVMAHIIDYHLYLMGAKEVCVYANPHTERFWQRLGFTQRESVILTRPCAPKTQIA